jgi:hypothetical protein
LDKDIQVVAILFGKTLAQVDSMPTSEFKILKAKSEFIYKPIPSGQPTFIRTPKRAYRLYSDIQQIPFARYAEIKTYRGESEQDLFRNLHLIIASMVQPYKRVCGIWVKEKYDSVKHPDYAEDLKEAKFIHVFNAVVFFYHLFNASIGVLKDYMISQMEQMGMSPEASRQTWVDLKNALDGFITANKLPTLKPSQLTRLGKLQPLKQTTPSLTSEKKPFMTRN